MPRVFEVKLTACREAWSSVGVPAEMKPMLLLCVFEVCGSPLIRPVCDESGHTTSVGDASHEYTCEACDCQGLTLPLMEEMLVEFLGGFDISSAVQGLPVSPYMACIAASITVEITFTTAPARRSRKCGITACIIAITPRVWVSSTPRAVARAYRQLRCSYREAPVPS